MSLGTSLVEPTSGDKRSSIGSSESGAAQLNSRFLPQTKKPVSVQTVLYHRTTLGPNPDLAERSISKGASQILLPKIFTCTFDSFLTASFSSSSCHHTRHGCSCPFQTVQPRAACIILFIGLGCFLHRTCTLSTLRSCSPTLGCRFQHQH